MFIYRLDKKILNQINDLMKKKHQLRLIELEESVLLAQVNKSIYLTYCFFFSFLTKKQ